MSKTYWTTSTSTDYYYTPTVQYTISVDSTDGTYVTYQTPNSYHKRSYDTLESLLKDHKKSIIDEIIKTKKEIVDKIRVL